MAQNSSTLALTELSTLTAPLYEKAALNANINTALSTHPYCPRGNYQNSPELLGFLIFVL